MDLEIKQFTLGPLENNSFLLSDEESREAAIIDPSFYSHHILEYARQENITITSAWITHAHFDHYAGLAYLVKQLSPSLDIILHRDDLDLWQRGGEAPTGIQMDPDILPSRFVEDGQLLNIGKKVFQILHTPGHSRGHVTFYHAETHVAFCGDLIFHQSIGRTDLFGGDFRTLISSIRSKILTLPPQTQLFSGHGKSTTVAEEIQNNPFLKI